MSAGRIGAIVLAGGRSSRFGRDKLAEPIDGRPLLEHAIAAARVVAAEVVVVLAPGVDRALPAAVLVAHDERAFEGPLAGVAAGLAALPEDIDRCLVVGGDMPTLSPAVLRLLVAAVAATDVTAAILDDGGPLPMAVRPRAAAPAARALLATGERRLRVLPERLSATVVTGTAWRAHDPEAATLRDIDTT
ncbi:MAG: NTP transferase domain-containing protein, partial [Chloroflexota bacterium]